MIKSLVFDKDGVLLDLIETWLPVMQGLAEYTLSLVPADSGRPVSRAMLLSSVGINDDTGGVDPNGLFARGSFFEIRAVCLLYTSPSPRDISGSRMPSSA